MSAGPGRPRVQLSVLDEAEQEVLAAADHYDGEALGLGDDFVAEYERVLGRITEGPVTGSPLADGRRRMLLARFPYAVVYRELTPTLVRIIAVPHHRRRPEYWAARDR